MDWIVPAALQGLPDLHFKPFLAPVLLSYSFDSSYAYERLV